MPDDQKPSSDKPGPATGSHNDDPKTGQKPGPKEGSEKSER